ncbi:MAG: sigma-54 dependent transcriptional regulator [Vicinamibacterales bacterium]
MTDGVESRERITQLALPGSVMPSDDAQSAPDPMRRVRDLAARVAPVDTTVLITGESGVGKERLARWLHTASPRRDRPFVAVNCGAFTDTLLESELFGHVRGAFTGATADRAGVFEAAHQGTLFLDEIGEVSPAMQVRLLRVLQEREVRRVGETRTRRVDVRLVTATNRDLPAELRRGAFRLDLYYRLRVVELHVPPLRARRHELAHLVETLVPTIASRLGRPVTGCSDQARAALLAYRWPGNIRELEHALEYACVMGAGPLVEVGDLPEDVIARVPQAVPAILDRERELAAAVVAQYGGDRNRAAAALGMSVSTLRRRLLGVTRPRVLRRPPVHE